MQSFFQTHKHKVSRYLGYAFSSTGILGGGRGGVDTDARTRLLSYTLGGKMIRAGLVQVGYDLFSADPDPVTVPVGAALELFQSGLLIHDDIMDRDDLRRGKETLHVQFYREAEKEGLADPRRVGEALGVCVGDLAFFLGFQILSLVTMDAEPHKKLLEAVAREMSLVGTAQMRDVSWGARQADAPLITEDEVLSLYRFKTGRYTFSLPLACGALLAGAPPQAVAVLEHIGEALGIIFQIKDDELGLFGEENDLGKPVGSDIREGKKTIYFTRLVPKLSARNRKRFFSLYGRPDVSPEDIRSLQRLITETGVRDEIDQLTSSRAEEVRKLIHSPQLPPSEQKNLLLQLLDYSLRRRS